MIKKVMSALAILVLTATSASAQLKNVEKMLVHLANDSIVYYNVDTVDYVDYAEVEELNFCPDNHHPHAIDLDLPSGTKWACCNVGATSPDQDGGYYAWGETETKSVYNTATYAYYSNGSYTNIGSDICGTAYDVAHVKWGGTWKMPTETQIQELKDNSNLTWTWQKYTVNGASVSGYLVKSTNGSTLFLPASGYRYYSSLYNHGTSGYYWSGSFGEGGDDYAYSLSFYSGSRVVRYGDRLNGRSVRAVCP